MRERLLIWLSGQIARVTVCETCGVLVIDEEVHLRWHRP